MKNILLFLIIALMGFTETSPQGQFTSEPNLVYVGWAIDKEFTPDSAGVVNAMNKAAILQNSSHQIIAVDIATGVYELGMGQLVLKDSVFIRWNPGVTMSSDNPAGTVVDDSIQIITSWEGNPHLINTDDPLLDINLTHPLSSLTKLYVTGVANLPDEITLTNINDSTIAIKPSYIGPLIGDSLNEYTRYNLDEVISGNWTFAGLVPISIKNGGNETATLGTEKLTNYNFNGNLSGWTAGAGWAFGNGGAQHTAGNTATLTQSVSVTSGEVYQVTIGNSNRTAGSVTITLGALDGSYAIPRTVSGVNYEEWSYSYTATATTTLTFTITPLTTYDGTIDSVSIKKVNLGTTSSTLNLYNTANVLSNEFRSDGTLLNQFIGLNSGRSLTTGDSNLGYGANSLYSLTTGYGNFALGINAGYKTTTAYRNTFIGHNAGYYTTTSSNNTAIGYDALVSNTTGGGNTAVGIDALYYNSIGYRNTGIGVYTLQQQIAGFDNVAVGYGAGYWGSLALTSLIECTFVGSLNFPIVNGIRNSIGIGYDVHNTVSNQTIVGNANTETAIIYGDLSGVDDLSISGVITGSSIMAGSNSFNSTGVADTVTITGAGVNDIYNVTLKKTSAPSANDFFAVRPTTSGFIISRSSSGTSDLEFMWSRSKVVPSAMADSLVEGLTAYWKLDETNGTRVDAVGLNDLTDNNTVLYSTGRQGNGALFDSTNSESLSKADNTELSMGVNQEFTYAFWVKPVDVWGVQDYLSKWNTAGNQREFNFELGYADSSIKKLNFRYSSLGTEASQGYLPSDTTIVAGRWYFVVGWYDININGDAEADSLYFQINNGSIQKVKYAVGVFDGTSALRIGASDIGNYSDAIIDETAIWKRVLTSDERDYLYNSGSGRTYSSGGIQ